MILFVLAKGVSLVLATPLKRGLNRRETSFAEKLSASYFLERGMMFSAIIRRWRSLTVALGLAIVAGLVGACTPAPTPSVGAMRLTSISSTGDVQNYVATDLKGGTEYWCLSGEDASGRPIQFRVYDGANTSPTKASAYVNPNEGGDVFTDVLFSGTSESGKRWSAYLPRGVVIPAYELTKKVPKTGQTCPGDGGWYGR